MEIKYSTQNKETNMCFFQEVLRASIMETQVKKKFLENKQFWKTLKILISDKSIDQDQEINQEI